MASISCCGMSPMHFTYWSADVVRPAIVPQLRNLATDLFVVVTNVLFFVW